MKYNILLCNLMFSLYFTGLIPHSNHAAAAVMIVNPTTPNAITGNMSQPFNVSLRTCGPFTLCLST